MRDWREFRPRKGDSESERIPLLSSCFGLTYVTILDRQVLLAHGAKVYIVGSLWVLLWGRIEGTKADQI